MEKVFFFSKLQSSPFTKIHYHHSKQGKKTQLTVKIPGEVPYTQSNKCNKKQTFLQLRIS